MSGSCEITIAPTIWNTWYSPRGGAYFWRYEPESSFSLSISTFTAPLSDTPFETDPLVSPLCGFLGAPVRPAYKTLASPQVSFSGSLRLFGPGYDDIRPDGTVVRVPDATATMQVSEAAVSELQVTYCIDDNYNRAPTNGMVELSFELSCKSVETVLINGAVHSQEIRQVREPILISLRVERTLTEPGVLRVQPWQVHRFYHLYYSDKVTSSLGEFQGALSFQDLVATSLEWDATGGGLTFRYELHGAASVRETSAQLLWAKGPSASDVLNGYRPFFEKAIPSGTQGQSSEIHVPDTFMTNRPAAATHIVLILDRNNIIFEGNETNNYLPIPLGPDLSAKGVTINPDGGVAVQLTKTGTGFSSAKLGIFWASGKTWDTRLADIPFFTLEVPIAGWTSTNLTLPPAFLAEVNRAYAPAGRLLFVIDYPNSIPEVNEQNNLASFPAVNLAALEVTQAVQDWTNSVTLVESKKTLVRGFLQLPEEFDVVYRPEGAQLLCNGSPVGTTSDSIELLTETSVSEDSVRVNRYSALAFEPPPRLLKGKVAFQLHLPNAVLVDPKGLGTLSRSFTNVPPPKVYIVSVRTKNSPAPSRDEIATLKDQLAAAFPCSEVDYAESEYAYPGVSPGSADDFVALNRSLSAFVASEKLSRSALFYGALQRSSPPAQGNGLGLATRPPNAKDFINAYYIASGLVDSRYPMNHVHELGHLLGRPHPARSDLAKHPQHPNFFLGPCGEVTEHGVAWPYYFEGRPALGPTDRTFAERIYGWDSFRKGIISPESNFDLMGYCRGPYDTWPAKKTYEELLTSITSRFARRPAQLHGAEQFGAHVLLRGTLPTGGLMPLVPFISEPDSDPISPETPYSVRLLDSTGAILLIAPLHPYSNIIEGTGPPPADSFIKAIPFSTNVHSVQILAHGQVINQKSRSAHPPVLEATLQMNSDAFHMTWSAHDEDSDPLSYLVEFSRDGGVTWRTLTADLTETNFSISLDGLAKTDHGLLRLTAVDDLNFASILSEPFTISNKPPELFLRSPLRGASFHRGQTVILEAHVYDREDGSLPDSAIRWHSDKDGELGAGKNLHIPVSALQEGIHTMRVDAHDSDGGSNSLSFQVEISSVARPILQLLSVGTNQVVRLFGDPQVVHRLEFSTDLNHWVTLATNILDTPYDYVADQNAGSMNSFYRAAVSAPLLQDRQQKPISSGTE